MSKTLLALPFALALACASLGCAPDEGPVPANPTYTSHVQAIFIAQCVHCHGANDMLNAGDVNGFPLAPSFCYLQRYETTGDCSNVANPDPSCKRGAGSTVCTSQIPSMINLTNSSRMPPPPADPLTNWQKQVINNWALTGYPQ
ncbi:MAG TPA: hypothetical protein VN903_24425 [Polyangia bacterium]|jgi:hypothetical protein|nr:hypothetical protein [Polyangia bacterium]